MAKRRIKLTGVPGFNWDPARMRRVATPIARVAAMGVVMLSLGLVASRLAKVARDDGRFLVVPSQLVAEELPRWLPTPVQDVIRERVASVPPVPIFDEDFGERLAAGLRGATPWIEDVRDVERLYPNRARVVLVLRRPVASVIHGQWRYLLDDEGRVLHREPSNEATRFESMLFPIYGAAIERTPVIGERIPDAEVAAAAHVANELLTIGDPWAATLKEIEPTALEVRRSIEGSFAAPEEVHLRTASSALVEWGRPRTAEHGETELSVERKLGHLQRILQRHPRLRGLEEVRVNLDQPYYRPAGGGLEFLSPIDGGGD